MLACLSVLLVMTQLFIAAVASLSVPVRGLGAPAEAVTRRRWSITLAVANMSCAVFSMCVLVFVAHLMLD